MKVKDWNTLRGAVPWKKRTVDTSDGAECKRNQKCNTTEKWNAYKGISYFFCQNSNWDTNLFDLSEETAWCNIMVFVRTKYEATRPSLPLFVKIPLKFVGPANFDSVLWNIAHHQTECPVKYFYLREVCHHYIQSPPSLHTVTTIITYSHHHHYIQSPPSLHTVTTILSLPVQVSPAEYQPSNVLCLDRYISGVTVTTISSTTIISHSHHHPVITCTSLPSRISAASCVVSRYISGVTVTTIISYSHHHPVITCTSLPSRISAESCVVSRYISGVTVTTILSLPVQVYPAEYQPSPVWCLDTSLVWQLLPSCHYLYKSTQQNVSRVLCGV